MGCISENKKGWMVGWGAKMLDVDIELNLTTLNEKLFNSFIFMQAKEVIIKKPECFFSGSGKLSFK